MICHDTTDRARLRGYDPVAVVMEHLAAAPGEGDLELLAAAVAAGLSGLAGVRQLALVVDPERAALVDANWTRSDRSCLLAADGATRWVVQPGLWGALIDAARRGPGGLAAGQGEIPGGALWRDPAGESAGSWFLLPIPVQGHAVASVVVEMRPDVSPEAMGETEGHLADLGRALAVVTRLWARAVSQAGELNQARNDNDSLSRLNRLQGRFVAVASHELKTPLTSITAYTDVLRAQLSDTEFPRAGEFLGVIRTEADRLLRMVHRILDFTRMEYGSKLLTRTPTEIVPLVAETVRTMQPTIVQKKLAIKIRHDDSLPRAAVDADLIRQVLVNLIGNAVKFSPPGGLVTVTVTELESAVSVSVADRGPGIAPEDIRRIFREFYRADETAEKAEGTGLGLTIARHIVKLHGGHIEARRRRSGGAEFRFMVPKMTGGAAQLPLELGPEVDPRDVRTLVDELLRLVGELTGSRAVALMLRDGNGALVPAGAMGWSTEAEAILPIIETEAWTRFLLDGRAVTDLGWVGCDLAWCRAGDEPGQQMFAPLGAGDSCPGLLITSRRREAGGYGAVDLAQLNILADVARAALAATRTSVGPAIEAVRLLLTIRRTGVPTSTPEALDLLARLARHQGVGQSGIRRLQYASALHDAGMARVEEEIVLGGTKLSVDERDEVDRHVEQGVDLMAPLLTDTATADIIRHHHEKFDGTGFPDGLLGDEIPHGARLLAVIDAWFSLTRARPFRTGLAPDAALTEIASHAGTQFDPAVVRSFAAVLDETGILPAAPHGSAGNPD